MRTTTIVLVAILAATGCGPQRPSGPPAHPPIEGIAAAPYKPSLVAEGPSVDVNHHRACGMGLVHSPKLQASLQGILDRIAAQAPVQGLSAHVYIRAIDTWGATSTADANLFVNLGTIRTVESEDEMAAVLAHELSHVILGHYDSDALESVQERAVQLSLVALMASGMAGAGTGAIASATKAVYAGATSLKATEAVVSPAWRRDQEADADFLGVDLLARAGWDPNALVLALEKQKAAEARKEDDFSLFESIKQASVKSLGPSAVNQKALTDAVSQSLKVWIQKTASDLARNHPDTSVRITDVTAYVAAQYPANRPELQTTAWTKILADSSTKTVLKHYVDASAAEEKLEGGDPRDAEKLARSAASGATQDHAKPVLTLLAVEEASGRRKDSLQLVQRTIDGPEPSLAAYVAAARIAEGTGDPKEAARILEKGWKALDRPPEGFPPLIRAYKQAKRDSDASLLSAECAVRYPKYQLAGLCNVDQQQAKAE